MAASETPSPVTVPRGDQSTWTKTLDPKELARHINYCETSAPNSKEKGARLESLMVWLLSHLPGLAAKTRNIYSEDGSQEIDVLFWNEETSAGYPGASTGAVAGECKNWQKRVDGSDIAWFDWKLRLGGVSHGIVIAANGITKDDKRKAYATSILAKAHSEGRTILVLTFDDLRTIESTQDLRDLLIRKTLSVSGQAPFD